MMTLNDIHPETKRFQLPLALKIAKLGTKRIRESGINDLECSKTRSLAPRFVHHEDLELGTLLGKGSFSAVYEIKKLNKKNADNLVIKVLQPTLLENAPLFARCASDLVREGLLLARLSHPNVLSCLAYTPEGVNAYASGRHDAFVLVLERLEVTIKEKLEDWRQQAKKSSVLSVFTTKHRRMEKTLAERIDVLCSLANALCYLHSQGVMHRDLKPDNLGLTADGCLKVFDLDVCGILPAEARDDPDATFKLTRKVGSPRYMAPEVARGDHYNAKSDVYAFGLLAYELLGLKKPYLDNTSSQMWQIYEGGHRPECPARWPSEVKDLITSCWDEDASNRPTMKMIKKTIRHVLNTMCPIAATREAVTSPKSYIPGLESASATHRSEYSVCSQ